jgi:hypothetical protein
MAIRNKSIEAPGDAPRYACRTWVNFDGTLSSPITPRASGNVSSVIKNGTGDYTINFLESIIDTNYSLFAQSGDNSNTIPTISNRTTHILSRTTTSVRVAFSFVNPATSGMTDEPNAMIGIFR